MTGDADNINQYTFYNVSKFIRFLSNVLFYNRAFSIIFIYSFLLSTINN